VEPVAVGQATTSTPSSSSSSREELWWEDMFTIPQKTTSLFPSWHLLVAPFPFLCQQQQLPHFTTKYWKTNQDAFFFRLVPGVAWELGTALP
jgi:hypothetical protein